MGFPSPESKLRGSAARPLPLKVRSDLEFRRISSGTCDRWVLKDPIALRYFHLSREEFFLLQRLDGTRSLVDLRRDFKCEFPTNTFSTLQLQTFLSYLHENSLITGDNSDEAQRLLKRRDRQRKSKRRSALANPLAICFPGINPGKFLDALIPHCRWLFSSVFLGGCLFSIAAAILLLTVQSRTLYARLPDFQTFFTPSNLLLLMAAIAGAKLLHEMAHALTCRHFGGNCHEIGFMLLVFTPCLYCDVTDAWMLSRRRERILISAAGMFAELVLASVCTFLWWFSQPGLLNSLCLNQMLVCSTATLFFNGNPLLRYDGYYILSDLVNVPNLRQRSSQALRSLLARAFLGMNLPNKEITPAGRERLLAAYAVASTAYKLLILVTILWFYSQILEPYQLQILPQVLALLTVVTVVLIPTTRSLRWFSIMASSGYIHWLKFVTRSLLTLLVLSGLFLIPLPRSVPAVAVLEPAEAHRLYVTTPGVLKSIIAEGVSVKLGEVVAELENAKLSLEISELQSLLAEQRRHLDNLNKRRIGEPEVEALIPAARERISDLEARLEQRLTDVESLTIRASRSGQVFAIPHVATIDNQELPTWSGNLHDPQNQGCYLEAGTQLCTIGDPDRAEAILLIDQSGITAVRTGQKVRLFFSGLSDHKAHGGIVDIATTELENLPPLLAKQLHVRARKNADRQTSPDETIYLARVRLDGAFPRIVTGTAGNGRIDVAPQSLAQRIFDYLSRTFRLDH